MMSYVVPFVILVIPIMFTIVSGIVCDKKRIKYHNHKEEYCDAHKFCFTMGEADGMMGLMAGICLGVKDDTRPKNRWINLNALMHKTDTQNENHWIFGDGDWVSINKQEKHRPKWDALMLPSAQDRVAFLNTKGFIERTRTRDKSFEFACHMFPWDREQATKVYLEKYRISGGEAGDTWSAVTDDSAGCVRHYPNMTAISCAL
ncbi:unnamed protein product [Echinostoma caproni]|uniref:C-type lectin domain-containing protein n=1 Tax=Echinostoma caproni TaxID=27848 RepID=A0A183AH89_9TREM|nr:unnamed protein product [Echinostoma caproni]